jgi:hypothetical protein
MMSITCVISTDAMSASTSSGSGPKGENDVKGPRGPRAELPHCWQRLPHRCTWRLVEVTSPDLAEVAPKLPAGRLHASGGGLVPYIKGPLYLDLIAANLSDVDPPASPDPTPQEIPGSWDEIGPAHVVIAKETSECGWWDAVVVERTGDLVTVAVPGLPGLPEHDTAPVGHRTDQPGRQVRRAGRCHFCGHLTPRPSQA